VDVASDPKGEVMTQQYLTDREAAFEWADQLYELRDIDGNKIGDVIEVNPDYLVAESDGGFLGLGERRRYYVPIPLINRDPEGHYRVSIAKDDVDSMAWGQAPSDSSWATTEARDRLRSDHPDYDDERPDATRLIRWEEELQASTTDHQVGEVVVRKDIVEETRTVEVPVRREEVHVERRAPTGNASSDTAFAGQDETVRVPVMEEQVEVRKVARPVEEIEVTKTPVRETRQVQDTVRREEFAVEDTSPAKR
jgi:uncharacterized protein (TIGR02271 family)